MKKHILFFALFIVFCRSNGMDTYDTEIDDLWYRKNISFLLSIPQLAFVPVLDYVIVPDYQDLDKHFTLTFDEIKIIIRNLVAVNPFCDNDNHTATHDETYFKEKVAPTLTVFPMLQCYYATNPESTTPKEVACALFWLRYRQKPEHLVFLATAYALNYFEGKDYIDHKNSTAKDHAKRTRLIEAFLSTDRAHISSAKAACRETKTFYKPNLKEATRTLISEDIEDLGKFLEATTLHQKTRSAIELEITKANEYIKNIQAPQGNSYFNKCILS